MRVNLDPLDGAGAPDALSVIEKNVTKQNLQPTCVFVTDSHVTKSNIMEVGHKKQRKVMLDLLKSLCLGGCHFLSAFQHGGFCAR